MKTPVAPDKLFAGLDGTHVSVDGSAWRVEVFSVIDGPDRRWLQIALDGAARRVLTLRLHKTEGPRQIARQISSWLANPSSIHNVLERVA